MVLGFVITTVVFHRSSHLVLAEIQHYPADASQPLIAEYPSLLSHSLFSSTAICLLFFCTI